MLILFCVKHAFSLTATHMLSQTKILVVMISCHYTVTIFILTATNHHLFLTPWIFALHLLEILVLTSATEIPPKPRASTMYVWECLCILLCVRAYTAFSDQNTHFLSKFLLKIILRILTRISYFLYVVFTSSNIACLTGKLLDDYRII